MEKEISGAHRRAKVNFRRSTGAAAVGKKASFVEQ